MASALPTSPSFNLLEPPAPNEAELVSSSNLANNVESAASIMTSSGIFAHSDSVEEAVKDELKHVEERLRSSSLNNESIEELAQQDEQSEEDEDQFEDAREVLHSSPVKKRAASVSEGSPLKLKSEEEEITMSDTWRHEQKHIFILSDAGKPIYSRHGDEDELSSLMAVMQAHVSFVHDLKDNIRAVHTADTTIVFLNKGPLILVAVSKGTESVTQLIVQLTYMYHQLLSVLTLTQLTRIFEQKKGYDLRKMIGGSERLLDSLANSMDTDPSFMLSAVKVLAMPSVARETIANTISQHCGKIKNVVFAVLIANNRLVTLVRMKKYFIHPADLHLIFNLVNSSESFKMSESWTPICLPKFDSSGFMHAHVSYLTDNCEACLLILTVERDIFFELSEAKKKIVTTMEKSGSLIAIRDSIPLCNFTPASIGMKEILHFLYKSKTTAQFTSSQFVFPYYNRSDSQERLHKIYLRLQSRLHSPTRPLKLAFYSGPYENVIAWSTQTFELYAAFSPLMAKMKAISAVNKLLKWTKKEESSLFILTAPTFP